VAYDEKLAGRVRKLLARRKAIAEKKMFDGVAFLLNGNMCCGIPMKGWILVKPAGVAGEDTLAKWVSVGVSYAASLPAKKK